MIASPTSTPFSEMSPTVEISSSGAGSMRLNAPFCQIQPLPMRPSIPNATPPTSPASLSANACDVNDPGGSSVFHVPVAQAVGARRRPVASDERVARM